MGIDNRERMQEDTLFTFIHMNQKLYPEHKDGYDLQPYKDLIKTTLPKNDPSMGSTTEFNYPPEFPIMIHSLERYDNELS